MATARLDNDERRKSIVAAAVPLFARNGFAGTTTRELAEAASISEALLFKHFPNKEALYSAMLLSCCQMKDPAVADRLKALEPSASSLVILVHLFVSHLVEK